MPAREPVRPPALSPGDRVAVVAPASGSAADYPHVYQRGIETLESRFDLVPVEYPTATKDAEYLYGHPEERARDVMDAFRDDDVAGVVATIGGNDQARILGHLDPGVLRENPTRFYGISDNTHLASYLWSLGVVSFYGGMVMTDLAAPGGPFDYTADYLERAFFAESLGDLRPAATFTDHDLDWNDPANLDREPETEPNPGWEWAGGTDSADGPTWGGCLEALDTVLAADVCAPDPADLEGAVLFVETSEELPDAEEVRRMLFGLGERGYFDAAGALLVGRAKARNPYEAPGPEERAEYRMTQRSVVERVVADYTPGLPVVFGIDAGHTYPTAPIPVGGRCIVDPAAGRITFPG